jgi:D-inositol-3-phosphate glycosyltransferase
VGSPSTRVTGPRGDVSSERADDRPSDRAGPRRVGLLSVHTTPLAQPGAGDSGGMNVTLAELSRRLVRSGLEVDVYTRSHGNDLPRTVTTPQGVRVHHLEAGPPHVDKRDLPNHLCAFYLALNGHHTVRHLDVLHAHYWMSGWVGRKLRRRRGIPLVQSFHTLARLKNAALAPGDVPEPALRVAAEDRVVADADAILAASPAEAASLRRQYRAMPGQVHVTPLGVDLDTFRPDGDASTERAALGGGRIVLFVGRLQPLKGPDLAVRALAALDAHLPDDGLPTRLVIVGGPSGTGFGTVDPPRLRELAEGLGVADRIAFLRPRPQHELPPLYRAADVVVMPSRSETFGLVALEAQASGTPVVAADVGGLRSAVAPGAGTLVAGHEPAAYAAALAPYLKDRALRERAGAAGVDHARKFGWDRVAEATTEVYRSVSQRATSSPDARGA